MNNTPKQESLYNTFIGIDISKFDFVSAIFGKKDTKDTKKYSNDEAGWNKFFTEHQELLDKALVIMEVTGGYEYGLLSYLQKQKNIAVHRADTRKVKNYIRSYGTLSKTDEIDAMALASYGYERHDKLELFVLSEETQEELKLLEERYLDLVKMLVAEKNRAKGPRAEGLKLSYQKVLGVLEEEIDEIQKKIQSIIDKDDNYKKKQEVLMTIDGVGKKTSHMLLSLIPELGKLDRKQIASLTGLAPHPKQSGQKSYYRATIGGRRNLRPLLFMAALGASRSKSFLGEFYKSLIARGKKAIVAQTALMRKIIVIANARLRDAIPV